MFPLISFPQIKPCCLSLDPSQFPEARSHWGRAEAWCHVTGPCKVGKGSEDNADMKNKGPLATSFPNGHC
jgi:hypothetical protein